MSYTVKNVKGFMGRDCPGYNATLCCDGVRVAEVINDGGGGMTDIRWFDTNGPRVEVPWTDHDGKPITLRGLTVEESYLYEAVRGKTWSMGPEFKNEIVQMDVDYFVGDLVFQFQEAKRFGRLCKTQTLFRVKGQEEGAWMTFRAPFCKRIKDLIAAKYGDKVEVIMNETLGQVAV